MWEGYAQREHGSDSIVHGRCASCLTRKYGRVRSILGSARWPGYAGLDVRDFWGGGKRVAHVVCGASRNRGRALWPGGAPDDVCGGREIGKQVYLSALASDPWPLALAFVQYPPPLRPWSPPQVHHPPQEAEEGQEGGPHAREARGCQDPLAEHGHCSRDDRVRRGCVQRQVIRGG